MHLRVNAGFGSGLLHFLAMFIETGEKEYFASTQSPVARQDVSRNGGIGVSDMRDIIDVVNRGGDVEFAACRHTQGKISGWRRVWLGRGSDRDNPECLTEAEKRCLDRHLYVQVSGGLLRVFFNVVQEGQEKVNVCSAGESLQVGHLIEMKDLVAISIHEDNHKVTDPSRQPAQGLRSPV